jgi:hypothetical protein
MTNLFSDESEISILFNGLVRSLNYKAITVISHRRRPHKKQRKTAAAAEEESERSQQSADFREGLINPLIICEISSPIHLPSIFCRRSSHGKGKS